MKYIFIIPLMYICAFFQDKIIQVSSGELNQFDSKSRQVSSKQAADLKRSEIDEEMKYSWVWKYIDECSFNSRISRIEHCLDQRMANQIYTRNMAEYYNLDFYKINTGNHELDLHIQRLASGVKVDNHKCEQDLESMVDKLHQLQQIIETQRMSPDSNNTISLNESHIRLASVLESFGHYDSGVLGGRNVLLGSYLQCLRSQLILDDEKPEDRTPTRYCLAQLKIDKHLDPQLRRRKLKKYDPDHLLNVGICIPESCHSISYNTKTKHLIQTLVDSQFKMPSSLYIDERLEVESIQCEPDKDSEVRKLSIGAKVLVAFLSSWIFMVLYATYQKSKIESSRPEGERQKTIETVANSNRKDEIGLGQDAYGLINLQTSWRAFTSVRSSAVDSRVNLDALSFVKVWGCLLVVYGHTFLLSRAARNSSHLYHLSEFDKDPVTNAIVSVSNIVDSFFVMSGILMAYLAMKKTSTPYRATRGAKEQSASVYVKQWLFLFLTRYSRLVPLFFLVFWFKKSLFVYLGSGPNWDYGLNVKTYVGLCRQVTGWSAPFSLFVGFFYRQQSCLGTGWSVSNDIFYAFALSPILILMTKKPFYAIILCSVLSLASTYSMYSSFVDTPPSISHLLNDLRVIGLILLINFSDLWYQAPHNRAYSVLVGISFGYFIYNYEQQCKGERKQWPRWLKGIATKLSILVIFLNFFALPIATNYRQTLLKQYPIHKSCANHLITSSRLIWLLSNCVVFLRMTTDWKDNILMKFCSARIWQIMAKLSFPILLIHMEIYLFKLQSHVDIPELSWIDINYNFISLYTMSCLMGAFLHIFFEVPINNLIKVFILDRISSTTTSSYNNITNKVSNDKHID